MTHIHSVDIDSKTGSSYVYFEPPQEGAAKRQVNIGDSVILDLGKDGRLVGMEILDPSLTAPLNIQDILRAFAEAHVPVSVQS
ncbi:MAG TPA: DUF2283 domain-containing protein [Planctomycetota bacterium]|nr:DUF2283 domain-containing protein [Planctomycetota bacterium]